MRTINKKWFSLKSPIDIARHVVANLDEADRRTLAEELTGKAQPHTPVKNMRMCRYCGGLIRDKGVGPRFVYCQRSCWTAAEGFDGELTLEQKRGKESLDNIQTQVEHMEEKLTSTKEAHDVSLMPVIKCKKRDRDCVTDGGAEMEAMFDHLDGTTPSIPKLDLAELLRKAKEIHPLLPSIIAILADGATQTEAARKLKVSQSVISEAINSLRASRGY